MRNFLRFLTYAGIPVLVSAGWLLALRWAGLDAAESTRGAAVLLGVLIFGAGLFAAFWERD